MSRQNIPISSFETLRSLSETMMSRGRLLVAESLQRDRHVGLRLATAQLGPILAGLAEEVFDRFLVLCRDRLIIQEKAPAVEIQRDGASSGDSLPCLPRSRMLRYCSSIQVSSRVSDFTAGDTSMSVPRCRRRPKPVVM